MSTWSFYDPATGRFTGRSKTLPDDTLIERNTPPGLRAIRGTFDKRTQRVDSSTGEVVTFEMPEAEIAAEQRALRRLHARRRIAQLELAQQRPMRELVRDPNNAEARRRLDRIEAEIAAQRDDLSVDVGGG